MRGIFQARVLNSYNVRYFSCDSCGLLQTGESYWLEEPYRSAIADSDTGLVSRNLNIARRLSSHLDFYFDPRAHYAEFAGGYGLLTRLIRDRGFDLRRYDPYRKHILARGFERDQIEEKISSRAVIDFDVKLRLPSKTFDDHQHVSNRPHSDTERNGKGQR
jgi:hypothetical protein